MAWIKGKVGKNKKILEGYQPSHGPKKPIAPVGGSGVSDIEPTLEPQYWKNDKKMKPEDKMQLVLKEEGSMFPILIQYTDTKEYATCKQPSDINVGKRFKIIKTDFK